jgi:hypothetical protein
VSALYHGTLTVRIGGASREVEIAPGDTAEAVAERAGDPIADLIAGVKAIRASIGPRPATLLFPEGFAERMDALIQRIVRRKRKALRLGLSSRYGQRRRQRAEGVALARNERRWRAARWLSVYHEPC